MVRNLEGLVSGLLCRGARPTLRQASLRPLPSEEGKEEEIGNGNGMETHLDKSVKPFLAASIVIGALPMLAIYYQKHSQPREPHQIAAKVLDLGTPCLNRPA